MTAKNAANTLWQEELFLAYEDVGGIARMQGNREAAIGAYGSGLTIARALVQRDPTVVQWQVELALALARLGLLSNSEPDLAEALAILKGLEGKRSLPVSAKGLIPEVEAELARVRAQPS
jgi:hypothetical protein